MSDLDRVHAAILRAVRDSNQQLPKEKQIPESPDAVILGESSSLDSLGLITLLVAVEQEIDGEFGEEISLVDDVSELSEDDDRFTTISNLATHISKLLNGA